MADIDSISIELTANTQSAEDSIQRLIDTLRMLNAAAMDSAKESKVAQSIRNLAKAAREVSSDSAKNVLNLALALREMVKVGDLSNLADAGRNLSGLAKAVNSLGKAGDGFGGLAKGLRETGAAFDSIKDQDVGKVQQVANDLSGMTSGPLFTSNVENESPELGGMGTMAFDARLTMLSADAYLTMAENIGYAEQAFRSLTSPVKDATVYIGAFTRAAQEAENAMASLGNTDWTWGNNGFNWARTWAASRAQQLGAGVAPSGPQMLNDVPNYTTGTAGIDKSRAIEIEDLGETAASTAQQFERLSDAERFADFRMKPLEDEANSVSGRLRDIGNEAANTSGRLRDVGAHARGAGTSTRIAGTAIEEAGERAKKGSSGIAKFLQSLKRIAYYRMIRSIIRGIANAFKEGAQNLYQWSTANPSLSDFAKNMNRIATSVLYLKNSLGAMLEPIVRILTPVIEWVIDKIVWLTDKISQFFAALSGAETYTAAKKVATTWSDAAKDVSGSTKSAADDIKRTILGFDEINKLNDNNSSSGSGGSGSSAAAQVNDMFEERPLDPFFQKIADYVNKIKDTIEPIKQWFDDFGDKVKHVWDGFVDGAKDFFADPIDWLGDNVADPIINGVKKLFGIASPSKEMKIVGGYLIDGLQEGMKEKLSDISKWIDDNIIKPILAAFENKSPTMSLVINVATNVTAERLFELLQTAWDRMQSRTLYLNVAFSQSATYLYDTLQTAWNNLQSRTLYLSVALSQSATYLYETLKTAWNNLQSRTLYLSVAFSQSATYLFDTLQKSWNNLQSRTLYVTIDFDKTAAALFTGFLVAWNILTRTLEVNLEFDVTPLALFTGLLVAWNLLTRTLYVTPKLDTSADELYKELKKPIVVTVSLVNDTKNWAANAWKVVSNLGAKTIGVTVSLKNDAKNWAANAWKVVSNLGAKTIGVTVSLKNDTKNWAANAWKVVSNLGAKTIGVTVSLKNDPKNWAANAWKVVSNLGAKTIGVTVSLKDDTKNWAANAWKVVSNLGAKTIGVTVSLTMKKEGWTTVTKYVDDNFGGATGGGGGTKGGGAGRNYTVGIGLTEYKPNTVSSNLWDMWWGIFKKTLKVEQDIALKLTGGDGLEKSGGGYKVKGVASEVSVKVNAKAGDGFVTSRYQTGANSFTLNPIQDSVVAVDVTPGWTGTATGAVGLDNLEAYVKVSLYPWWNGSAIDWLGLNDLVTTIKAQVIADRNHSRVVLTQDAHDVNTWTLSAQALGGIFENGFWSSIPQYANGTHNAHGSLFLAGEAGPEIVGHVGGRTEVLNKSQLASAMYSAVNSAMSGVTLEADFSGGAAGGEADYDAMYRAMYDAFSAAMARSDAMDREKVELLRQINAKEFSTDISTSAINRAQMRANRRAGTTIVPLGT